MELYSSPLRDFDKDQMVHPVSSGLDLPKVVKERKEQLVG